MTSSRRVSMAACAVVAAGLCLASIVALIWGAPTNDVLVLMSIAAGGATLASVLGMVSLRLLRRRSLQVQAVVIAAATIAAAVVGVLLAAWAMFISPHDLGALLVVVTVSTAVALGAALQLGRNLDRDSRQVRDMAQRIGTTEPVGQESSGGAAPASPEFEALAGELAELPARLDALRAKEDAIDRSRRELVAWVSHDLRSPLATIRAMAEALDDGVVSDEEATARYHHQIRKDAERLSALVDDLFELSRIHSGALVLRGENADLGEVVTEAVADAVPKAEAKGVKVVARHENLPRTGIAATELTRVVHNLMDNAIRHTPSGGTVLVMASAEGAQLSLSVQDECGGIPEPDLDRVFDVAFRGDAARSRDERGGGLGLAIARGLVEAFEGTIEVDNGHRGCRFTIVLPLDR